jgi:transforming growth factor-beta-induced protein
MGLKGTVFMGAVALATSVACSSSPASPVAPSASAIAATEAATDARRSAEPSIAEIAVSGGFSTLVAALDKAGLVGTFSGNKHFTVFAPTNAAFTNAAVALQIPDVAAPAGVDGLDLVAALSPDELATVLLYHVTAGDRNSTSVLAAGTLVMLDGNRTTVSAGRIDNATITAVDIRARNGIVHVIDAVILPPA